MDNRKFNVTLRSKKELSLALQIAFTDGYDRDVKAVGYKTIDNTLIFYSIDAPGITKALYPITHSIATDMVWEWLKTVKPTENEPDMDGDVDKAFKVYCDNWGRIGDEYQAFVAIKPKWALFGK